MAESLLKEDVYNLIPVKGVSRTSALLVSKYRFLPTDDFMLIRKTNKQKKKG